MTVDDDRPRPEEILCEQVEPGRFVGGLERVTREELIGPREQILDVASEDELLMNPGAQAGERMRVERVVSPGCDLVEVVVVVGAVVVLGGRWLRLLLVDGVGDDGLRIGESREQRYDGGDSGDHAKTQSASAAPWAARKAKCGPAPCAE